MTYRIKHTTGKHTEKDGWNVPASGNTLTQRYANARYHIAINAIPREQSFICNFLLLNKKIVANEYPDSKDRATAEKYIKKCKEVTKD